jgi:hypothetical protein
MATDDEKVNEILEVALSTYFRVVEWKNKTNAQMRLQAGELTAGEIRTIKAVLNCILPDKKHKDIPKGVL